MDRYFRLRRAADWYFDTTRGPNDIGSVYYVLNVLPGVDCDRVLPVVRQFVLNFWTPERVRKLIQGELRDKVIVEVTFADLLT